MLAGVQPQRICTAGAGFFFGALNYSSRQPALMQVFGDVAFGNVGGLVRLDPEAWVRLRCFAEPHEDVAGYPLIFGDDDEGVGVG